MLTSFIEKIRNKEAVIGILGLGYVGLPLMLRFAEVGYRVIGIDVDEHKNDLLNQGISYIQHIPSSAIVDVKSKIIATSDFAASREADVLDSLCAHAFR